MMIVKPRAAVSSYAVENWLTGLTASGDGRLESVCDRVVVLDLLSPIRPRRAYAHRKPDAHGGIHHPVQAEDVFVRFQPADLRGRHIVRPHFHGLRE